MAKKQLNNFRVSPSKLGALCAPDVCERCYWLLMRMKFKMPFSWPMPGVMFHLDEQQKQLARVFLGNNSKLPSYFGPFCEATEVLDIPQVSGFHDGTELSLFGKPDLVLRNKSGQLLVIDNKTAMKKPDSHALSGKYVAQTNFYGFLLEQSPQKHTVAKVGILYYEFDPLTDKEVINNTDDQHMWSRFSPVVQEVEYDPQKFVVPLLQRVRDLLDQGSIPDGEVDCPDCQLLNGFIDLIPATDSSYIGLDAREKQRLFHQEQFRQNRVMSDNRQRQLDSLPAAGKPGGILQVWAEDEVLPS